MKPDYRHSKIYIALPAMDELLYLPQFIECVKAQTFNNYELVVCVNQPKSWWFEADHLPVCENNQKSIDWLREQKDIVLTLIDKSSEKNGWNAKKLGVGWARKVTMDFICEKADDHDIIISLDADTTFSPDYFQSIIDNLNANSHKVAISIPYYHLLTEDKDTNKNMLRYEIYMRHYALNLWRIKNPYNFSALGSAIAVPVWVYKRVGGISPHKSGEDFYFLLKLRKFGLLQLWNKEKIYPAARYSDRVFFGTGPAMIKGASGDWSSYPIYDYKFFDEVQKTYDLFGKLFSEDIDFPMKFFLAELFKDKKWFVPLRENSATKFQFIKACQHKADALRILQYLKFMHKQNKHNDEELLSEFILKFYQDKNITKLTIDMNSSWSFDKCSVSELNSLRNFLVAIEEKYQKNGCS